MRNTILRILEDLGIYIGEEERQSDFDLSSLFVDSVQFITFVLELEKQVGIELPDNFLLLEQYRSFYALCDALANISKSSIKD